MKKLIFFICTIFVSNILVGQTILPTVFSSDAFLPVSNSPYLVTSNPTINSGVTVQFEKGCTIMFNQGKAFNVLGTLKLIGGVNDSITLITNAGALYWGPITTNSGTLIFDYTVLQNPKKIIAANNGVISINNSRISAVIGSVGEDGIAIHNADSVIITNSIIEGDPNGGKIDAIDADDISYGNISNNIIRHWPDDGTDIGTNSTNVSINNNIIYDTDCGISVGESSSVYAERNLIYNNYIGIQSHDGATVTADHNTIYKVSYSLLPHHGSYYPNSGGTLIVTNTIMNNAIYHDFTTQSNSTLTISYCLSNKDTLLGTNNLFGKAFFKDTTNLDFHLTANSPAIDNGDPNYTGLFNNLHTDMGAFEYDASIIEPLATYSKSFAISPNPATSHVQINIINAQLNKNTSGYIYNTFGQIVMKFNTKNSKCNIAISNLQNGIYFIKIGTETLKFIKY